MEENNDLASRILRKIEPHYNKALDVAEKASDVITYPLDKWFDTMTGTDSRFVPEVEETYGELRRYWGMSKDKDIDELHGKVREQLVQKGYTHQRVDSDLELWMNHFDQDSPEYFMIDPSGKRAYYASLSGKFNHPDEIVEMMQDCLERSDSEFNGDGILVLGSLFASAALTSTGFVLPFLIGWGATVTTQLCDGYTKLQEKMFTGLSNLNGKGLYTKRHNEIYNTFAQSSDALYHLLQVPDKEVISNAD